MNWDTLKGKWQQAAGNLQKQWGKLTEDDLDAIEGDRKKLFGRLQEIYGYSKEKAEQEIAAWEKSYKDDKAA